MKLKLEMLLFFVSVFVYSQESENLFEKGNDSQRKEDYAEAIIFYTKAIELDDFPVATSGKPLDVKAHTYIGRAYSKKMLGDYMGALKDYTEGINVITSSKAGAKESYLRQYYVYRGELKLDINDYKGALIDFKKGTSFDEEGNYLKGLAYLGLKDYKSASGCFESAISFRKISGNAPSAIYHYNLGYCKLFLNLKVEACENLRIAGDLGDEDAYDLILKHCN